MTHRPTPHSIALAALISLHCQLDSPLYVDETSDDFSKVDSFLQDVFLTSTAVVAAPATSHTSTHTTARWSSLHGPRVNGLLQKLGKDVNEEIRQQFRSWLLVASTSIDALSDLLTTIQRAVTDGSVDAASANGMFLRSCSLGFNELSFESVVQLWKDFQGEVQDEDGDFEQQWTISSDQMESAVREQCLATASLRGADLEEMQSQLQAVLNHNPELSSAHFLRFLLCLQTGERVGAVDALHQYMDSAVVQDSEDILQFAAILKAALHKEFGEHDLVSAATEEAVRVAQQSQDAGAVAFALGWLAVIQDPTTTGAATAGSSNIAADLMQRCAQRAGNLRSLAAGANLSLAAATLSWTAHHQAVTDSAAGADASMSAYDRPTHVGHLEGSVAAAQQKLVAAGLWNHFGETTLSALSSATALHCHGDQLTGADVAVAIHNLCFSATLGSTAASGNNMLLPDMPSHPYDCIYGNAIRIYLFVHEAYQMPVDGIFLLDAAIVLHEWAVRRGDLEHAEAIMTVIESNLHPRLDNYTEIVLDVVSQRALLLQRQGRWGDAKSLLKNVIATCKAKEQHGPAARLLLQLSMLHLESNQNQFTTAICPLLDCLTLSKKHKMDGLHVAALCILAQVHLRMGNGSRSVAVLQASLPSVLKQGHVWLQAEAYLTLAKCRLKQAKDCQQKKTKQCKILQAAAQELVRSEGLFLRCQDYLRLQEVYYLLARGVYHVLPDAQGLRDAAAERFLQVSSFRKTTTLPTAAVLSALTSRDGLWKLVSRPDPVINVM